VAGRHLGTSTGGRRRRSTATSRAGVAVLLAAVLVAIGTATFAADGRLQPLCIDATGISVSGISSGGFMADQFHVAHSTRVMGAGIFAAGPYLCAGADYPKSVFRALNVCSHFMPGPFLGPPEVQRSIAAARGASEAGDIDDLAGLRGDRLFLFSGRRDTLVPESVVDTVQTSYRAFDKAEDIALVSNVDAAHAMVTKAFGNACETSKAPFVNRCGYDLAGAALRHIYGPLAPPTEADGELVVFDQTEFVDPAKTHGLAERGYEYVPKGCTEHRGCRLHVAFHGCQQNADAVGDAFYGHAGYNEWAEANDIVVLYPQAAAVTSRVLGIRVAWPNPQGCWDWWGFTGADFATKNGAQISAVNAMIDRLSRTAAVSGSSAPGSSCAPASGGCRPARAQAFPTIDHRSIHVPQLRRTAPADACGLLG
jgi:poly(3-hydroxybutyrate) depolymerase